MTDETEREALAAAFCAGAEAVQKAWMVELGMGDGVANFSKAASDYVASVDLAALRSQSAGEWLPIESALRDGTDIQARIPGNGEDNVIAWQVDAFLNDLHEPCGGWAFTTEQEPPECWTDGFCWVFNEDGVPSVQPTHWKPLPTPAAQGEKP